MTQPVKLHILPPNHTGPVVHGSAVAPHLRCPRIIDGQSMAGMAYHSGTLYTDTAPNHWQPVDVDRASALGYGHSDPWPFPDRIEAKPAGYNMTPGSQFTGLELQVNRQNKVNLLNVHIKPRFIARLESIGVRVSRQGDIAAGIFNFYEFDALTIGQLVNRIQTRLQ